MSLSSAARDAGRRLQRRPQQACRPPIRYSRHPRGPEAYQVYGKGGPEVILGQILTAVYGQNPARPRLRSISVPVEKPPTP